MDDLDVAADIREAESLPARAFREEAIAVRERETIFARHWLMLPERTAAERRDDPRTRLEQVAARGARAPLAFLDRPLFLQRGWDDDVLRLFPNACTHAWYPLVHGPSRGNAIACGQHGRKFDCAGRFLTQPGMKDLPGFPRACDHLERFAVEEWRGFVFAALGTPHAPLSEALAEVDESLSRMPLEGLRLAAIDHEVRDVLGNWKQHAWNYMDSFHVTFIHRAPGGLADAIDMSSYRTELHRWSALQWAYARDPSAGFDPEELPDRFRDAAGRRVFALWWFVFPNLALNVYPWGISVNLYMPVPGAPETTRFAWFHRVRDEAKYARRDRDWLSAQVDAEDVDAMAQVMRGLRSGVTPRGRFSPEGERGPHWFHRLVSRELLGP